MEGYDMALPKHNRIWDSSENDHFHHNSPPPPVGVEFMVLIIITYFISCRMQQFSNMDFFFWSAGVGLQFLAILKNLDFLIFDSSKHIHKLIQFKSNT